MHLDYLLNIIKNIISILTDFGKTHGKKALTILTICIVITVFISGASSLIMNKHVDKTLEDFRSVMKQDVMSTLIEYENAKDSIKRSAELATIEKASIIKSNLKAYRKELGCDYIMICQFHNNIESIAGCQFIKFDVTYNVHEPKLSGIDVDDFQNVNISKYDIIPTLWRWNTSSYTIDEIKDVDELLYTQIRKYAPTIYNIVFSHISIDNNRDGVIIYMFNKKTNPDFISINNCTESVSNLLSGK